MVDTNKLKGYITMRGYNLHTLAKEIGVSYATISYKANNKRAFTPNEIVRLQNTLDLTRDEVFEIFLAN